MLRVTLETQSNWTEIKIKTERIRMVLSTISAWAAMVWNGRRLKHYVVAGEQLRYEILRQIVDKIHAFAVISWLVLLISKKNWGENGIYETLVITQVLSRNSTAPVLQNDHLCKLRINDVVVGLVFCWNEKLRYPKSVPKAIIWMKFSKMNSGKRFFCVPLRLFRCRSIFLAIKDLLEVP